MKQLIAIGTMFAPSLAYAHVGHIGALAGHDHVVIGAVVIGGAILAGVLSGLSKGGNKDKDRAKEEPAEA